jgi:sugar (pentulose or hexulose) kinase
VTLAPAYLAIDLGTSAVKAARFDRLGRVAGLATVEYELATDPSGRVECDPETYWDALVQAVRATCRTSERGHGRIELEALAITSQAETLLCLDPSGAPLRPAIVWLDNRSGAEAVELGERLGTRTIYGATGQMVTLPTSPASKILWLARHEHATFQATATFCLVGDWIARRLTGRLAGDITTYPTSLLLDVRSRAWWTPMLDVLELTPRHLPALVEPGGIVGHLRASAAEALGLDRHVPVVSGAMDTIAGAVGSANLAPGLVTEATGTYLAPLSCLESPPPFSDPGFPVLLHALPDRYCALPYGQTAGAVLRWLHDLLATPGRDRPRRAGPAHDAPARPDSPRDRDYESLVAEAETVPPGSDGVVFLPHLAGSGFPDWDPSATAAIAGLRLGHGRGHVVRAALEAVAFMLRGAIEGLRDVGARIDGVTSVGPASRSTAWLQIKADVCQLPVSRLEQEEASLLGAAMLAAVACGEHADLAEAASAMVRTASVATPDTEALSTYDDAYARYRSLYRDLRPFDSVAPGVVDRAR